MQNIQNKEKLARNVLEHHCVVALTYMIVGFNFSQVKRLCTLRTTKLPRIGLGALCSPPPAQEIP